MEIKLAFVMAGIILIISLVALIAGIIHNNEYERAFGIMMALCYTIGLMTGRDT